MMLLKRCIVLLFMSLVIILPSMALARLTPVIYLYDGNTPLEFSDPNEPYVYKDIMAGTHLVIEIECDIVERDHRIAGMLEVAEPYGDVCTLAARDFNETTGKWEGSILPAAGTRAYLYWTHSMLFGTGIDAVPGPWFVFDYIALQEGPCVIELYTSEYQTMSLTQSIIFEHVPSRDFNLDAQVNFLDFALLAENWSATAMVDPNTTTPGDLDKDGVVDGHDLQLFVDHWLEVIHLPDDLGS